MKWTEDQRAAIASRGEDLLLSAAAGSGKTTVLVERVLSLIDDGADIEQFLIVTFSRAAAADMRRKLTEELSDRAEADPRYAPQLEKVERASVSTIHSFCADILREHFESAGVDPMFRILDEPELRQLEAEALREAMEAVYLEGGDDLDALVYGRSSKAVGALALALYKFSLENPDPARWLREACESLPLSDGSKWFDELARAARADLRDARASLLYALELTNDPDGPAPYAAALSSDLDAVEAMLSAADYPALCEAVAAFKAKRFAGYPPRGVELDERQKALKDQVGALRDAAKKHIDKAKKALMPMDVALEDMRALTPALRALARIATALGENLDSLKADKSALSYADLEHRALRALSDPRVSAALRARYQHVFVDEYQDVSSVQEAILRATAAPGRLFMVGDVKQSIYRFRQAEPTLFLEKYRRFSRGEGGRLVALKQNFRSRASILELTNRAFERVMTGGDAEIEYDDAARLRPGAAFEGADPPLEIHILEKPDGEASGPEADLTSGEREGALIARRISQLVGTPYYDARRGCERPLEYRDFVVLTRTRAAMKPVEKMLTLAGIPVYADASGGYFDALEVELAVALLRVIDNRRRDLELMSALRSPVAGLTSAELAEIRSAAPAPGTSFRDAMLRRMEAEDNLAEKLRGFEARLTRWRALSRVLPLGQFVDLVLRESGFYAYAGGIPGGGARQANLDLLCDYASKYESAQGGGLSGFLAYFRDIRTGGDDLGAAHALGEEDQVVRLMTIHKSKGLEFPVVLATEMGRRLDAAGRRGEFYAHRALGVGIRLNDIALGTSRETLAQAAIGARLAREDYNEEMRILYVLLTRSIDRLILVGRAGQKDARTRFKLCGEAGLRPMTYLEVVEPAAQAMGAACAVYWHAPEAADEVERPAAGEMPAEVKADDALRRGILWRYPYEDLVMQPLKLTVSGLVREETGPRALPPLGRRPLFMTEEGPRAAEYGTLTHNALMAVDLVRLRGLSGAALEREVSEQIAALRASGRLYGDLEANLLVRFFEGSTGRRLLNAERVEREWPFNLRVAKGDERFLVQGVIDCCFIEEGEWVLLDYKTDRADDPAALMAHYRPQIEWYARALREITGIPVREKLICLLRAGLELTA